MKIRILRTHNLGGGHTATEGEVLDLPDAEALYKIQLGHAEAVSDVPPAKGEVHFTDEESKSTGHPAIKKK